MSYVTAMLRQRAQRATEEAIYWKGEASLSMSFVEHRIRFVHEAAKFLNANQSLPDDAIQMHTIHVERGESLAFDVVGIREDHARHIAEALDEVFKRCVTLRQIPECVRVHIPFDRGHERATFTVYSFRVPMEKKK